MSSSVVNVAPFVVTIPLIITGLGQVREARPRHGRGPTVLQGHGRRISNR